MNDLIGREKEIERLNRAFTEKEAQLIIVYGRRRVGKTFLIHHFFQNQFAFQITGVQNYTKEDSLTAFAEQISIYSGNPCPVPGNWREAFMMLRRYLDTLAYDEKIVVFWVR